MLKAIWNWLRGVETTVEDIVAPMSRMIADLATHAEQKLIEKVEHEEAAIAANAKAIAAKLEADKAKLLATEIGDLIS